MSKRAPELIEACVVFIDIIGFRTLADRKRGDPSEPLAVLEWLDTLGDSPTPHHHHRYLRLSDSAVYVEPTTEATLTAALRSSHLWAVRAQQQALDRRLLLRGGMTHGLIYCDQDRRMVFGPALHRAYSLESSRAVVPRIVVDKQHIPSKWRHSAGLFEFGDGRPFIQYLGGPPLDEWSVPRVVANLEKHEAAVHRLTTTSRNPRNLAMCNYLVSFHNGMVDWVLNFVKRLPPERADRFRSDLDKLRITGFDIVPALLLAGLAE
jgi:hypothetical protein